MSNFETTERTNTDREGEVSLVIPVIEEKVEIGKKTVETGRVRIRKEIIERQVEIPIELSEDHYEFERVAVDAWVDEAPRVRVEGDLTVVPVVEEVVEIHRRLRLKEEIHIRRHTQTTRETVETSLREEKISVEPLAARQDSGPLAARKDTDFDAGNETRSPIENLDKPTLQ